MNRNLRHLHASTNAMPNDSYSQNVITSTFTHHLCLDPNSYFLPSRPLTARFTSHPLCDLQKLLQRRCTVRFEISTQGAFFRSSGERLQSSKPKSFDNFLFIPLTTNGHGSIMVSLDNQLLHVGWNCETVNLDHDHFARIKLNTNFRQQTGTAGVSKVEQIFVNNSWKKQTL